MVMFAHRCEGESRDTRHFPHSGVRGSIAKGDDDTTGSVQPLARAQGHRLTVEFQRVDPDQSSSHPDIKARACNEAHASYISPVQLGINRKMTSPAHEFVAGLSINYSRTL